MNSVYLDDYSNEEKIDYNTIEQDINNNQFVENSKKHDTKPGFKLKSDYNSKGEKIVVFSINIPLKKENDALTIDILINDDMYKNIGNHFKS